MQFINLQKPICNKTSSEFSHINLMVLIFHSSCFRCCRTSSRVGVASCMDSAEMLRAAHRLQPQTRVLVENPKHTDMPVCSGGICLEHKGCEHSWAGQQLCQCPPQCPWSSRGACKAPRAVGCSYGIFRRAVLNPAELPEISSALKPNTGFYFHFFYILQNCTGNPDLCFF